MRPKLYCLKTLAEPEKKLAETHRECLAVVWAVLPLCPYLTWSRFTVGVDQSTLMWLLTMTEATGMAARWRLCLVEFDVYVIHRLVVRHQVADALSHLKTGGGDTKTLAHKMTVMAVFNQRQTQNGSLKDHSDEKDSDSQ